MLQQISPRVPRKEKRGERHREQGGERRVARLADMLPPSSSSVVARRRRLSELRPAGVFSLLLLGVAVGCVGVGAGWSSHIFTPDPSPPCRDRFLLPSSASMTSAVSGTCSGRQKLSVSDFERPMLSAMGWSLLAFRGSSDQLTLLCRPFSTAGVLLFEAISALAANAKQKTKAGAIRVHSRAGRPG